MSRSHAAATEALRRHNRCVKYRTKQQAHQHRHLDALKRSMPKLKKAENPPRIAWLADCGKMPVRTS
jgi:hypothetical protein